MSNQELQTLLNSDLRREERVERASREMEVLHQTEYPGPLVAAGLLQAVHGRSLDVRRVRNPVPFDPRMCQLTLVILEPARGEGSVWQKPEANEGDEAGDGSLDDEQPSPACDASEAVHTGENSCSDQAGETGCEDLSTVKDSDTGGNFSSGVEDREHVSRAGIELCCVRQTCQECKHRSEKVTYWSLSDPQEEPTGNKTSIVLNQCRASYQEQLCELLHSKPDIAAWDLSYRKPQPKPTSTRSCICPAVFW